MMHHEIDTAALLMKRKYFEYFSIVLKKKPVLQTLTKRIDTLNVVMHFVHHC